MVHFYLNRPNQKEEQMSRPPQPTQKEPRQVNRPNPSASCGRPWAKRRKMTLSLRANQPAIHHPTGLPAEIVQHNEMEEQPPHLQLQRGAPHLSPFQMLWMARRPSFDAIRRSEPAWKSIRDCRRARKPATTVEAVWASKVKSVSHPCAMVLSLTRTTMCQITSCIDIAVPTFRRWCA